MAEFRKLTYGEDVLNTDCISSKSDLLPANLTFTSARQSMERGRGILSRRKRDQADPSMIAAFGTGASLEN